MIETLKKQICLTMFLPHFGGLFISCENQINLEKKEHNIISVDTVSGLKFTSPIYSILEDSNGNYWISSFEGVCCYNGATFTYFPDTEGRALNVRTLQEDIDGKIWFETRNGINCYDGVRMTSYKRDSLKKCRNNMAHEWKINPNDLWFDGGNGMFCYNGENFRHFKFPSPKEEDNSRGLGGVSGFAIGKDKLWIATVSAVMGYDGTSFTFIPGKGLNMHVRDIYEDSSGNLWIANNLTSGGYCGIMRYDGNSLTYFSNYQELIGSNLIKGIKVQPGSLLRIFSIGEDKEGNIWFGTADYGAWRFDGKLLKNYTLKDGLTSMAVTTIYRDKRGNLLLGMDDGTVCKFNGKTFEKVF